MSVAQRSTKLPESNEAGVDRVVNVLAISPYEEDQLILRNIFGHSNWRLRCAKSWREARTSLQANVTPVVLCEAGLPDGTWQNVLVDLEAMPGEPLLIVTARSADERLWAEVLNLGGYDVLMKPFDHTEVVRVISLAWLNWKHQHESALKKTAASAGVRTLAAANA